MTAYRIGMQGQLDARWTGWFEGMTVVHGVDEAGDPVTTLCGSLADQAALRGLLSRIWDLNLTLLSVTRVEQDGRETQ